MDDFAQHGGKRIGAGRKAWFDEPLKQVRVPESLVPIIKGYVKELSKKHVFPKRDDIILPALNPQYIPLPQALSRISAGFPSPADDYIERRLDLNEHLVARPSATFIWRVAGESMSGAGILPDDMVIVDRSLEAKHGDIVIAEVNGEPTIKRLFTQGRKVELHPENPDYPIIQFQQGSELIIWGVVSGVIRKIR
jgi:DNA polymerase V